MSYPQPKRPPSSELIDMHSVARYVRKRQPHIDHIGEQYARNQVKKYK